MPFSIELVSITGANTVLNFTIHPYQKCTSLDTKFNLIQNKMAQLTNVEMLARPH